MGIFSAIHNIFTRSAINRERVPTIMQQEAAECGAACLAMIMAYYGRWVSLEILREQCGVSRDGSKANNLLAVAEEYGFIAKGFSMGIDELHDLPFPFITFWKFNHFVVIEGMNDEKVWLNDPATGPRIVSMDEFNKAFTGIALAFEPGEEFKPGGSRPSLISVISNNLRGVRKGLFFAILTGVGLLIPGIIVAGANRIFVDDILVKGEEAWLIPLLAGLGISALFSGFLTWLQKYALVRTETALGTMLAVRYFWTLLKLPLNFFSQRYAGDVANRMAQAERMASLISSGLAPALIGVIPILGYGLALFFMDYVVALYIVGAASLALVILSVSARNLEDASRRSINDESKLYGMTMQGLSMREDFRASGTEGMFLNRWYAAQGEVLNATHDMTNRSGLLNESAGFFIACVSVVVLVAGGLRVMDGALTIGMLLGIQALSGMFTGPVMGMVGVGGQLQSIRGISERISDTLNAEDDDAEKIIAGYNASESEEPVEHEPDDPELAEVPLALQNVSFSYSPMMPLVINDFTLNMAQGSRIALVGSSGSGKSTLGLLMTGLREPTEGQVHIYGTQLKDWPVGLLRREISYVDQNVSLFEGTVKDNITLWDETMPEANYVRAAQDALVHDIITSRPGGYQARLIEGGRNLSGGERQRLALARALAVNPRIMVLDEATSALDPVVEKAVMDSVRRRGCTCVLIAHRISTIQDCDIICVMDQGRVVEHGTHNQLMAQGGLYKELVEH